MSALILHLQQQRDCGRINLKLLLVIAVGFSIVSEFRRLYSYTTSGMPTGPWVIITLSAITLFSITFAPKRGFLSKYLIRVRNEKKINDENILKTIVFDF